jgi:hypothetical protein
MVFFSWQGAYIERAEVQVLHVEDPENVWVRRLQDKSYFFQLDEEIQEYCRYTKILVYPAGIFELQYLWGLETE